MKTTRKTQFQSAKVIKAESAMKRALISALPKRNTCPSCERSGGWKAFGVRTMGRRKDGMPREMRIQSYCRLCRKEAAKAARLAKSKAKAKAKK